MKFLLIALALLVLAGLWLALRQRHLQQRRHLAVRAVLDAADTLEARLRTARDEIDAIAGDDGNPVRAAMQELLRQRLWLQDNAQQASLAKLDELRVSLDTASTHLESQLQRVDRARTGAR